MRNLSFESLFSRYNLNREREEWAKERIEFLKGSSRILRVHSLAFATTLVSIARTSLIELRLACESKSECFHVFRGIADIRDNIYLPYTYRHIEERVFATYIVFRPARAIDPRALMEHAAPRRVVLPRAPFPSGNRRQKRPPLSSGSVFRGH